MIVYMRDLYENRGKLRQLKHYNNDVREKFLFEQLTYVSLMMMMSIRKNFKYYHQKGHMFDYSNIYDNTYKDRKGKQINIVVK